MSRNVDSDNWADSGESLNCPALPSNNNADFYIMVEWQQCESCDAATDDLANGCYGPF